MGSSTVDLNVSLTAELSSPAQYRLDQPASDQVNHTVIAGREAINRIISKEDPRMLLIVGPCSIHDPKAAMEYADRFAALREEVKSSVELVMRVYFEKPRTTIGWKGLITDPQINGSEDVAGGLRLAREILLQINERGIPAATEFLDPIVPQYIGDLVSWAAIGARTTESQTHRMMASGLSMAVGFKNSTEGNVQIAVDALQAAIAPHAFLGISEEGRSAVVRTKGNPNVHLILRGGRSGTNFGEEAIIAAEEMIRKAQLRPAIMVDCSHANSQKQHRRQIDVFHEVLSMRNAGRQSIIGMMVESHLNEGNQGIPEDLSQLRYGVSITDACINWEDTDRIIRDAHRVLSA